MIVTDLNVLRQKSAPVAEGEDVSSIIRMMEDFLLSSENGIGLSAIQLGIAKRIIAVKEAGPHSARNEIKVYINPEIVDQYDPYVTSESCLSFPGETVTTKRFMYIQFKDKQRPTGYCAEGKFSHIVQHEIDHLDGITMHDRKYNKVEVGRNDPCPCGSGKKYKKCCVDKG